MAPSKDDIDLNRITVAEYRSLFAEGQTNDDGDKILAKACGVEPEMIAGMGFANYRALLAAFFKKAREPLADPS